MIPGSVEWRAFVLSETAATVREWRGRPTGPDDEITVKQRQRDLCEALDGRYVGSIEQAG